MWWCERIKLLLPNGTHNVILYRLHDSFFQVRGQILLIDPLPSINKVFALISQKEHRRKISKQIVSGIDSSRAMAFAFKNRNNKGIVIPGTYIFCTHRNFHGHSIDKYNKLHGYLLGYNQNKWTTSTVLLVPILLIKF